MNNNRLVEVPEAVWDHLKYRFDNHGELTVPSAVREILFEWMVKELSKPRKPTKQDQMVLDEEELPTDFEYIRNMFDGLLFTELPSASKWREPKKALTCFVCSRMDDGECENLKRHYFFTAENLNGGRPLTAPLCLHHVKDVLKIVDIHPGMVADDAK